MQYVEKKDFQLEGLYGNINFKKNNMNGKILLDYWKNIHDELYSSYKDLDGLPMHSREWHVSKDSITKVVYLLKRAGDIDEKGYNDMLHLLHSVDTENWVVLESIIEAINTNKQLPNNY